MTPDELVMKGQGYCSTYTHCEIHPAMILGVCASIIPFPDHNQVCSVIQWILHSFLAKFSWCGSTAPPSKVAHRLKFYRVNDLNPFTSKSVQSYHCSKITFSKIVKKWYQSKVLPIRFHLNGNTARFLSTDSNVRITLWESILLYKRTWNTRWAFARKLDIFTCENITFPMAT